MNQNKLVSNGIPCASPLFSWAWSYQQKKSKKFLEFGSYFWILAIEILPKIFGYYFQKSGQLAAPKNQIWFFSDSSKKIWGFKIFRFIREKKLDLRIFVGRIKPRTSHHQLELDGTESIVSHFYFLTNRCCVFRPVFCSFLLISDLF